MNSVIIFFHFDAVSMPVRTRIESLSFCYATSHAIANPRLQITYIGAFFTPTPPLTCPSTYCISISAVGMYNDSEASRIYAPKKRPCFKVLGLVQKFD
jgi:hypothetical protein